MADIKISVASNNAVGSAAQVTASYSAKANTSEPAKNTESVKKSKKNKDAFKDVISVSKDGDTASATKESIAKQKESANEGILARARAQAAVSEDRLHEYNAGEDLAKNLPGDASVALQRVQGDEGNHYVDTLKAELNADIRKAMNDIGTSDTGQKLENIEMDDSSAKEARIEQLTAQIQAAESKEDTPVVRSDESSFKPQITSYDGYSDQQLRSLYLDGTISRYSYDSEMSQRAEAIKEFENNEQVFREGIVRDIGNMDKAERTEETIRTIDSGYYSRTLSTEARMEMLNAAEGEDLEMTGTEL